MKHIKNILLSAVAVCAALLAVAACSKDEWPEGADLDTMRIALSPDPGVIPAAGATFESVVTVGKGPETSVSWDVEVDFAPDWLTLDEVNIEKPFVGTYEGDDVTTSQHGIKVVVSANTTGKKRTASIRFTVKDGSSISYTLTQSK